MRTTAKESQVFGFFPFKSMNEELMVIHVCTEDRVIAQRS